MITCGQSIMLVRPEEVMSMAYTTKEDILKKWESTESRTEAKEIASIRRDIQTAVSFLADANARYRKQKLRVRSKAKAEENPFAELDLYKSEREIQDAYGWEIISEAECDRLIQLWRLREERKTDDGKYHDRVTDMIDEAIAHIGDAYAEQLHDYDERQRKKEQQAEQIAKENNQRTFAREHGMMDCAD